MRYSHDSYLPIGAFEPILGKIKLYGGGGNPVSTISDFVSNAVSDIASPIQQFIEPISDIPQQIDQQIIQPVSNEVSNATQTVGDVGNQIDKSVNDTIPGGWVLPAAIAVAATTGYLDPTLLSADMAAAPELDATGTLAAQAGVGTGVAGADATLPGALASDIAGEGTAQLGSGTSLSADASTNPLNQFYNVANPETQANLGTVSNLVGDGAESNLTTLDSLNNPLLPTTGAGIGGAELGATGSIIGNGQGLGTQTLTDTLAPTGLNGLTVNDLNSQPLLNNGTTSTMSAKDIADALRAANSANNLIKSLNASQQKLASNQQTLQQSQALGNLLKANQFTPMAIPPIYKAQNPFSFGQQEPIQGNPLASLLRNNYGNS